MWFLALISCRLAEPPVPVAEVTQETQVVLLGTGTPVPDPDRSGPCVAIVTDGQAYLVDMGPGVVRRAEAARRKGLTPLSPRLLDRVFVTHLHSDHTAGFPDLWLSPWVIGRNTALQVYGPPGIRSMSEHIRQAWSADLAMRMEGLEAQEPEGIAMEVHEIDGSGVVYRDEAVEVTAIAVPHGSWTHAYGYRFETRDRVIVVSGDTAPSEAIARACNGCDLLVHEVYSEAAWSRIRDPNRDYHGNFHTSTVELAKIAEAARPKTLLLYHQLHMGASDALLVQEIEQLWEGTVISGVDLGVY
jgi:ribonuclease Z